MSARLLSVVTLPDGTVGTVVEIEPDGTMLVETIDADGHTLDLVWMAGAKGDACDKPPA